MNHRFHGKTAIVTGASRGIGFAVAERLIADGASVVITARKQASLDEAVDALGGPARCIGIAGHADDPAHQTDVIENAIAVFGSADLLVNNTAINPTYGPLMDLEREVARKIVAVNCLAALSWIQ